MYRDGLATAAALIALVISPVLLAGCASKRLAFEKPGVTVEERRRDEAECLRVSADDSGRAQILAAYRIDRDAYADCMTARGYRTASR